MLNKPIAIAEILAALTAEGPLHKQLEYAQIWEQWDRIAGTDLRDHGRPFSVRDGVLRVIAEGPVWMHRFAYHKWKIIRRVNRIARKELIHDVFISLSRDDADDEE